MTSVGAICSACKQPDHFGSGCKITYQPEIQKISDEELSRRLAALVDPEFLRNRYSGRNPCKHPTVICDKCETIIPKDAHATANKTSNSSRGNSMDPSDLDYEPASAVIESTKPFTLPKISKLLLRMYLHNHDVETVRKYFGKKISLRIEIIEEKK